MKKLYSPFLKKSLRKVLLTGLALLSAGIPENLPAASVIWIGAFSSQWNNFKNWNCHCVPSDGDDISIQPMPQNQPIITAATAGAFIPRNLIIQNVASLTMTGGELFITGDWFNDGFFINSPGTTVTFQGTSPQQIGGTVSTTFYNLKINLGSSSSEVSLGADITVSNLLMLTNGGLNLNGKALSITNPLTSSISRISPAYIKCEKKFFPYGELKRTVNDNTGAYLYPFGKSAAAADYIPFIFNVQIAGSDSGTVSVSTYATPPSNIPYPSGVTELKTGSADNSDNVVDRFWIINLAGYSEAPRAALTFIYSESETPANGDDALCAQRWSGTTWEEPGICAPGGQISDASANMVIASGVTRYSIWTLSRNASPLPVTFLNFEARTEGENVNLFWSTATELNNDYFTIERSENSLHFKSLGKIKGAGNSSTALHYGFHDISPGSGEREEEIFYYRIRQTDFDGKYSFSNTIAVRVTNKNSPFYVYPNPSNGKELFFRTNFPDSKQWQVAVFEISGKEVFSKTVNCENIRLQALNFEKQLVKGSYLLTVKSGNDIYRQKLIIQ